MDSVQAVLSQDARVLPARIECSCITDTFLFLLFVSFPTFNDPLLNIGLNYKLKNTLERMYNRRLCMYIQYVKKPLFLYFKCSKLIKVIITMLSFIFYFQNALIT